MQSLKKSFLMLALVTVSFCSIQAYAQQEVDPDHYDQAAAIYSTHIRASKAQRVQGATAAHQADKRAAGPHSRKALASAQKLEGK